MTVSRAFTLNSVDGRLLLTSGDPAHDHAYDVLAAWVALADGRLWLCYSMPSMPIYPVSPASTLERVKARARKAIDSVKRQCLKAKRARRARRQLIGWSSAQSAA